MKSLFYYTRRESIMAGSLALLGFIIMCFVEIRIAGNTAITHNIEIWIDTASIVDFFFPLFTSLPFAWRLYFECKDGYITYVSVRTDHKRYIMTRVAAGMTAVFFMTFVMYYAGLLFAVICVEPEVLVDDAILGRYMWGNMQMNMPLVFGILWCVWKGIVGAVICLFGYVVALIADNIFVISLLPFVYCVLENFVTGTLGLESYSIYTSFVLNRLSPDAMSIHNYYIGVVVFIVITGVASAIWILRKKQVEYSGQHN